MKRRFLIGIISLIIVIGGAGTIFMAHNSGEFRKVRNMPINEVDLSRVSDGTYEGDFSYGRFTYVVEVIVKDHRIENIKILKNRDTGHAKKAEGVIKRVIQAQSLKVDAITGATTTSKTLLKAVENALAKAISQ
ncbi:MAG: FMN-binding protein [Firmicutes bacterium]|nr:FMN-binding protein [Bacillota bacterium]